MSRGRVPYYAMLGKSKETPAPRTVDQIAAPQTENLRHPLDMCPSPGVAGGIECLATSAEQPATDEHVHPPTHLEDI